MFPIMKNCCQPIFRERTPQWLKHGSGFIRKVFLIMVGMVIIKFPWDTFRLW